MLAEILVFPEVPAGTSFITFVLAILRAGSYVFNKCSRHCRKILAQLQRVFVSSEQFESVDLQLHRIVLLAAQQHYLLRVLRLKVGDRFLAISPNQTWLAQLSDGNSAQLLELLPPKPPLPVNIHLLAALPKNGFDDVVRQVTELGVGTITPILSDRTLLKPSPKKLDRWQRIAQEATEQCERPTVPNLQAPSNWQTALTQIQADQKYIAAARADAQHLLTALPQAPDSSEIPTIAIAIGPEGGWTEGEIEMAIGDNYQPITLGPTILRAVTASPAAVTIIMGRYSCI